MKTAKSKIMMVLFLTIGLGLTFSSFGQKREMRKDRLKEKQEQLKQKQAEIQVNRIAFYNTFLALTPAESDKFWPIYNEFGDKQKELRKNHQEKVKTLRKKPADQLTKEESATLINANISLKQSMLDLEKEYIGKYQAAISIQKVAKLKEAEAQFKKSMLQKARETRKQKALENKDAK